MHAINPYENLFFTPTYPPRVTRLALISGTMARTLCTALCALTLCIRTEGFLPAASSFVGSPAQIVAAKAALGSGASSSPLRSSSNRRTATEQSGTRGAGASVCMSAGPAKKIVVLGGDGFCGWPTCLHLSDAG